MRQPSEQAAAFPAALVEARRLDDEQACETTRDVIVESVELRAVERT